MFATLLMLSGAGCGGSGGGPASVPSETPGTPNEPGAPEMPGDGGSDGGGSDDGGDGGDPPPAQPPDDDDADPPPSPPSAADFQTPEYFESRGLDLIDAASGYALRRSGQEGGQGKSIAIIDSGLDLHTDLNVRARFGGNDGALGDTAPHGTHVAGIAAAKRNGRGVHGVAFNADIVSVRIAPTDFSNEQQLEDEATIAAAILSAGGVEGQFQRPNGEFALSRPEARSDVINMSFTTSDNSGNILRAMQRAAANGTIMVAALGNDGLPVPTAAPAIYADAPGVAGLAIAAGALDSSGENPASFSNRCASVVDYCLFAPGTAIRSTLPGDNFGLLSGTSMAAPHVAGAAATLLAAFPGKSPEEIVQRLLTTADDLGAPGIDRVFGHGRLNLATALAPVGFTGVPVGSDGSLASIDEVAFDLPSWADGDELEEALSSVLVQDSQRFPFLVDLRSSIKRNTSTTRLSSYIEDSRTMTAGSASTAGLWTRFSQPVQPGLGARKANWQARRPFDSDDDTAFGFGFGDSERSLSLTSTMSQSAHDLRDRDERALPETLGAWAGLMPAALRGGDGLQLSSRLQLSDGVISSLTVGRSDSGDVQSGGTSLSFSPLPDITLAAGLGVIDEQQGFWGTGGDDGFGDVGGSTVYSTLTARLALPSRAALLLGVSGADADGRAESANQLTTDVDMGLAQAYLVGITFDDVFADDQIAVTLSQPLRPERATMTLNVPRGLNPDGSVATERQDVDVSPTGRETNLQLAYQHDLESLDARWSATGLMRLEPDHRSDAEPELGAGVRLDLRF